MKADTSTGEVRKVPREEGEVQLDFFLHKQVFNKILIIKKGQLSYYRSARMTCIMTACFFGTF